MAALLAVTCGLSWTLASQQINVMSSERSAIVLNRNVKQYQVDAADVAVAPANLNCRRGGTKLACLIPPLTFHPYLPSQNQPLRLLPRFHQAALDQFDIQAPVFHPSRGYAFMGKNENKMNAVDTHSSRESNIIPFVIFEKIGRIPNSPCTFPSSF